MQEPFSRLLSTAESLRRNHDKTLKRQEANESSSDLDVPDIALFALSANFLTFAPAPEPRLAGGGGAVSFGAGRLRNSTMVRQCVVYNMTM